MNLKRRVRAVHGLMKTYSALELRHQRFVEVNIDVERLDPTAHNLRSNQGCRPLALPLNLDLSAFDLVVLLLFFNASPYVRCDFL
jgi:hypothetical protein